MNYLINDYNVYMSILDIISSPYYWDSTNS